MENRGRQKKTPSHLSNVHRKTVYVFRESNVFSKTAENNPKPAVELIPESRSYG